MVFKISADSGAAPKPTEKQQVAITEHLGKAAIPDS